MITSIIELPNFHAMDTALTVSAYTSYNTGENEVYLPTDIQIEEGRTLMPAAIPGLRKYKLGVTELIQKPNNETQQLNYYIIVLALGDLTESEPCAVFPIYMVGNNGTCWIHVENVNRLFRGIPSLVLSPEGTHQVCSLMSFINPLLRLVGGRSPDQNDYLEITKSTRDETMIELIDAIAADTDTQHTANFLDQKYRVFRTSFSSEAMYLMDCSSSAQIKLLINPYRVNLDQLADMATVTRAQWGEISNDIFNRQAFATTSVDTMLQTGPDERCYTGNMVDGLYSIPQEDFWYDIRTDSRDVSDLYYQVINMRQSFKKSFVRLNNWAPLIINTIYSFDLLGKFPNRDLRAHRTFMEELAIHDKSTGELLLYVDLVWWLLASAPGIINQSVSANFQ